MKLFQLTVFITAINCASINKRGLGLTRINSPEVNQQQDLETSEGWGFGGNGWGDNTWSANSFNNVDGLRNLDVVPGFGPGLGGFLFRRNMNLNGWASPNVEQQQSLESGRVLDVEGFKRRLPSFVN
jgi:hypothetical protein